MRRPALRHCFPPSALRPADAPRVLGAAGGRLEKRMSTVSSARVAASRREAPAP